MYSRLKDPCLMTHNQTQLCVPDVDCLTSIEVTAEKHRADIEYAEAAHVISNDVTSTVIGLAYMML